MKTATPRGRTRAKKASAEDYTVPIILRVKPVVDLSDDQFLELCGLNSDLQIERNAEGEWVIMSPVGSETGDREAEITMQFRLWAKRDGKGTLFSPSAGFRLPNTAIRAADAAWVLKSRLAEFSASQREKFLPLCPDFVLELRSPSDRLAAAQAKMDEWLANGARLGWLLDPAPRHVYVYRPDQPVERLDNPETISGDPILPGFVLDLREIW